MPGNYLELALAGAEASTIIWHVVCKREQHLPERPADDAEGDKRVAAISICVCIKRKEILTIPNGLWMPSTYTGELSR